MKNKKKGNIRSNQTGQISGLEVIGHDHLEAYKKLLHDEPHKIAEQ
jgi:hypothetical protein